MECQYKVSVIVAVYNTAEYLADCLACIEAAPNFDALQVIIVDDASTDASAQIIDAWAAGKSNVVVVHKAENECTLLCRVDGMEKVAGEYVCFVDSDDQVSPEMFGRLYDAAQQLQAEIVACGIRVNAPEQSWEELDLPAGCYSTLEIMEAYAERKLNSALWMRIYARSAAMSALEKLWEIHPERSAWRGIRVEDEILCPLLLMSAERYGVIADVLYEYREASASSNMNAVATDPEKKLAHAKHLIWSTKQVLTVAEGKQRRMLMSLQLNNLFFMLGQLLQLGRTDTDGALREEMHSFASMCHGISMKQRLRLWHLKWKYKKCM